VVAERLPSGGHTLGVPCQPIRLGGAVENGRACSAIEQACFSIGGRGTRVPADIVAGAKASEVGVRATADTQVPQPTQVQPCDRWRCVLSVVAFVRDCGA